jgi:hypothetical protein
MAEEAVGPMLGMRAVESLKQNANAYARFPTHPKG